MRVSDPTLNNLLRQVSRSFYLTLRILPGPIRPQMGLAYLLARATDTVADTYLVSVERRLEALRSMKLAIREAASGNKPGPLNFGELAAAQEVPSGQGSPGEKTLLEQAGHILDLLRGLDLEDRDRIREVLDTITRGQESDLTRFGRASADRITALDHDAELEEYTHRVAGCVGEFWTRMCRAHLFPSARLDDAALISNGVRFGKGLQLVNILRDIPRDLRQGRCYIPRPRLEEHGLSPEALLNRDAMNTFRRLFSDYLDQARGHLAAGWIYTNTIPRGQIRVRIACAWPILIGMKTLDCLEGRNVLDGRDRIQVRQAEVYRLMLRSVFAYPFPAVWSGQFGFRGKSAKDAE